MRSKRDSIKFKEIAPDEWAHPPPQGTVLQQVGLWLFDRKNRTVLGRDRKRWAIVVVFYTCFYSALALMFVFCMLALEDTISEERPTYILGSSLIGTTPGVTARPYSRPGSALSLREIPAFLEQYENETWYAAASGCKADDDYGFPDNPCFYLKLNKVYAWTPRPYETLPEEAPDDLREYVEGLESGERRRVWLGCWLDSDDANETSPTLAYPWGRGIDARYFPYTMQPGYRTPLVAVQVSRASKPGAYHLRCRGWARNIVYRPSLVRGSGFTRVHCLM